MAGFFYFARQVLESDKTIKFVSFLFSNQSSLESHFSQMRGRNADTPQAYVLAIGSLESIKTHGTLNMHSNKMYSETVDEGEVQVAVTSYEKATMSTIAHLVNTVNSWLKNGASIRDVVLKEELPVMDNDIFYEYTGTFENEKMKKLFSDYGSAFERTFNIVNVKKLPCHYHSYLLKHTTLVDSAIASVGSGSGTESWF